jgi:general secretion pathway protein D
MKSHSRWYSLLSFVVVFCLVAVPVGAFGKKGRDHYNRGLDYELAQQWEKAAQEFTLALAADPSNVDYRLHYQRAIFNASQTFMQQGRALAEQRDYVGAYNAFRQAFGYDPVNQLAVSEMERMLRLQEVKEGGKPATTNDGGQGDGNGTGTPATPGTAKPQEQAQPVRQEANRSVIYNNADLKTVIRTLADQLNLNVIFDRQSFAQPRQVDINLHQVTTAKALDFIFLQEGLFFQKLDRHTILVAEQGRRPQYQQLVVRTFYIANADPEKVQNFIAKALPASVGRPQSIVVADKDTNSLTVRDTAENVQLIGDLLAAIDKDRAEVVMDVNIYEVNRSDLMQFGNQLGQGTFNLGGSPGVSVLSNNGVRTAAEHGVNLSNIIGASPTGLAAALVIPPSVFQAFQSKSNGRLLAATQVHAFNNEESTARIGQRVPVQTAQAYPFGIQTGTPNPGSGNVFPSGGFPVINYEPTGLTLSFTPQVFPNLDVQVKMKIESKDVTGASTLTPTFIERTITGTARVQNNRTMMLASVSTEVTANGRQGLPVLGGLPWLGRLFTAPTKDNRQVDIVIAVTPRVLRAPAVTPRDEEMRPSGTLQAPTTGSLEAMMEQTAREDQQIAAAKARQDPQVAAARQIPRDVTVQLPDAPVTYEPAANVSNNQTTTVAQTQTTSSQPQPASLTPSTSQAQQDSAMPQPKTSAVATNTVTEQKPNVVPTSTATEPKTDVSTAINRLVSPGNSVSATSASAQDQAPVTPVVDQAPASNEKGDGNAGAADSAPTLIELGLAPEKSEITVGEKRQVAVNLRAATPLSLAVVTLRFDPKVLKVGSVSAGKLFANTSTAPTITQSIDPKGMVLVSIAPAAGSTVTGEGALLNVEFEAVGAGNSGLAFDLSNVHLVPADGHPTTLQLNATTLTVKEADGPPPPKPISNKSSANQSSTTKFDVVALAMATGLSQSWIP